MEVRKKWGRGGGEDGLTGQEVWFGGEETKMWKWSDVLVKNGGVEQRSDEVKVKNWKETAGKRYEWKWEAKKAKERA